MIMGGRMAIFELKPPEAELDEWAKEYWRASSTSSKDIEGGAFDAGREILAGNFSSENLKKIVYWKSPRVVHHIDENPPEKIQEALQKAIGSAASSREAILALTELRGVGVPVASAILTTIFPDRYTVIDFRALESLGHEPDDVGFYDRYLSFCTGLAADLARRGIIHPQDGYPAPTALRALDRALWQWSASKGILDVE
jgi:hypothetical protein